MNGPTKMYSLKQIVRHDFPVELPSCMYKIKNIHSIDKYKTRNGMVGDGVDHVSSSRKKLDISDQNNQNVPGMAELQHRQEEILKQLAELKKQMLSIKNQLNTHCAKTTTNITSCPMGPSVLPTEIVLNVNPQNPPYSLEFVQKILQNTIHFVVTIHTHSTVNSLPTNAKQLSDRLTSFSPTTNSVPNIHLRLIWKNVDDKFELMASHTRIIGEINFLRYVSRLCPNRFSYDGGDMEIDSLLDICYLVIISKNKTQRAKLLQNFTNIISKQGNYMTKNSFGIIDVAAYSAIKQVSSNDEVNVALSKWMKKCENAI